MASLKHTHQYVRYKDRSRGAKSIHDYYFRCADPGCTHFTKFEMVVGKKSRCNKCGVEFILDRVACTRAFPACLSCRDTEEGRTFKAAQRVMDQLVEDNDKEVEIKDFFD